MQIEQYHDRRTTPLKWHKFVTGLDLVAAIGCAAILALTLVQSGEFESLVASAIAQLGYSLSMKASDFVIKAYIVLAIAVAYFVVMFIYGRKFSMVYIVATAIFFGFNIVTDARTLIGAMDFSTFLSMLVTLAITALQVLYYYKRLPLFSKDYKDPEDENEGQINYDQANQ